MAAATGVTTPGAWARRRAGRSSSGRSKTASTSSTPRTAIRWATARRFSAAQSAISPGATRSSSPPRSMAACALDPNGAGLSRQGDLRRNRRQPHAASAWITSISIRSTAGITRTPIEETLEALHDVVKAGKASYIGASSMHAWQFARALGIADRHGWTRFVSMQNLVNLLYREEEREMLPLCAAEGIGVIPWSPQARGKLTRDWDYTSIRTETDEAFERLFANTQEADRRVVDRVAAVANARGLPRAQVALAWLLSKPVVTRADRRRHQAAAPRRCTRIGAGQALRRGDCRARRAVHAARRGRLRVAPVPRRFWPHLGCPPPPFGSGIRPLTRCRRRLMRLEET